MTEFRSAAEFVINRSIEPGMGRFQVTAVTTLSGTVVVVTERRKPCRPTGPDGHVWVQADGADPICRFRGVIPSMHVETRTDPWAARSASNGPCDKVTAGDENGNDFKKSRTGDPLCSEGDEHMEDEPDDPEVACILGKCQAKARMKTQAKAQEARWQRRRHKSWRSGLNVV